eukprot:14721-Heterococcus_DN1.PRE.3
MEPEEQTKVVSAAAKMCVTHICQKGRHNTSCVQKADMQATVGLQRCVNYELIACICGSIGDDPDSLALVCLILQECTEQRLADLKRISSERINEILTLISATAASRVSCVRPAMTTFAPS